MIHRRKLLTTLGAGALTAPFSARAQAPRTPSASTPGKIWRVGILVARARPPSLEADYLGAFVKRMRELGYVEGKNLLIEWRFADGDLARLPALATELVQAKVDVILANANQAVGAAMGATTTIPIVMGNAGDPVGAGFVQSLARPGRNLTGLSTLGVDISPKHLQFLREFSPNLARVAVLTEPANATQTLALKNIQAAGQQTGVTIVPVESGNAGEIDSAFARMEKTRVQGFILLSTPHFMQHRARIAQLALKQRLPFISAYREYVEAGALLSYGPSLGGLYRHAATYVDKIFKGAKPADLPVEQPTIFEMYINGKTAKTLGLKIPQSLLISADQVIE